MSLNDFRDYLDTLFSLLCYFFSFEQERMSQFWFNTYFVSQHATSKKLFEDEPTLRIVRLDPDLAYFDVGKEELDKAHKDVKETIFNKDFKVRFQGTSMCLLQLP